VQPGFEADQSIRTPGSDARYRLPWRGANLDSLDPAFSSSRAVLQPDQLLPSEADLAAYYGVHRLTVRRAIVELVREGLLRRQRGVGTFVAAPKLTQTLARASGFSERVRAAGRRPSSRVLSFEVASAAGAVAQRLGVAPGAPVYTLVRLRYADDEPVMLETAWLPVERFPGLDGFDFTAVSLWTRRRSSSSSAARSRTLSTSWTTGTRSASTTRRTRPS
jgi:GntR family transcriptional regulator